MSPPPAAAASSSAGTDLSLGDVGTAAGGPVRHGHVDEALDVVDRLRADDQDDGEFLPPLELPGHGEEREDCGERNQFRVCASCGESHTVGRTCRQSRCPRCGAAWALEAASGAAAQLEATRRKLESRTDEWGGWKFHHLAVSIRDLLVDVDVDDLETEDDPKKAALDRAFASVADLVEALAGHDDCAGGVTFFHPFRGEGGDDRGFWKWLLFDGDGDWDQSRRHLEFAPHFHVVVLARHVDGGRVTRRLAEEQDTVVSRITKGDSNVSIADTYDLARVATYATSHSGLYQHPESGDWDAQIRRWGEVSQTPADEHVAEEVDAACRAVAPRTLGLEPASLSCSRRLEDDDQDDGADVAVDHDRGAASGSAPSPGTSSSSTSASLDEATSRLFLGGSGGARLELPDRTVDLPDDAVDRIASIVSPLEPSGGLEAGDTVPEILKGLLNGQVDPEELPEQLEDAAEEIAMSVDGADLELGTTVEGRPSRLDEECAGRLLDARHAWKLLSDQEWVADAHAWDEAAAAYGRFCDREGYDPRDAPSELVDRALEVALRFCDPDVDGPPPG